MVDKKIQKDYIMSKEYYLREEYIEYDDIFEHIVRLQTTFAKQFHSMFIKQDQKFVEDCGSATTRALTALIQGNLACISNEVEEVREWLPWKHWKRYQGFDIDLEELRMEYIDMLHFVLEGMILLGMDHKDIHRYYLSKMAENHRRQAKGY